MLSAVVVNYRCHADTLACVNSLLRDDPHLTVVVVDNSEDPQEAAQLKVGLGDRTELLVNSRNTGFGAACNLGFSATDSAYVMLLNPDARIVPGCLSRLKSALESNPSLGAVSPLQWWDDQGQWLLPPAWLPTGIGMWTLDAAWCCQKAALNISHAYRQLALDAWLPDRPVIAQRALSGGAMMVRRNAVMAAGSLFDDAFFMYYEDSDLCLRLVQGGYQLGLVTGGAVIHAWQQTPGKVEMMEQSKHIYLSKHFLGKGRWEDRLRRQSTRTKCDRPLPMQAHRRDAPLNVPFEWQSGWLLEISPSALMVPAIGHIGQGMLAQVPSNLMERLGKGTVYFRLGPMRSAKSESHMYYSPVAE